MTTLVALAGAAPASAAPNLERTWGTYFGGSGVEYTHDAAHDGAGNVYLLGDTDSAGMATPGSHQAVLGGAWDAYLAKFDPEGKLVWATYFGGPNLDTPTAMAVRGDTVTIVGETRSKTGIATPGSLQPTHSGNIDDGFVATFTTDGVRKWSTYIGTLANAATIDGEGAVYVVGSVYVAQPGLTTPGTHQPNHGGAADGYLVKFTPTGELVWGTFYGGVAPETLNSVSINALGELYAAGLVYDPEPAIASPGAHQTEYGGGLQDDFLVRFNPDGTRAWATYYGGSAQEFKPRVAALPHGGVIFAGETLSDENIATPGAYKTQRQGTSAFLTRFDANGERQWGTYYGGKWGAGLDELAIDGGDGVYLCGESNSPDGLATPNGWLPQAQGFDDAWMAKFTGAGMPLWGTYYGGTNYEGCSGLTIDASYRVYMVGSSDSTDGIATPGAHQDTYSGSAIDSFVVQFDQPVGEACAGPEDCGGGACVDGVCCDGPCGGGADDCQTCSASEGASADGVCTLLAAEVVCRPSTGTCDAAEHCTGDAGICPTDAPAQDGEPCDEGVCSAGACVPEGDPSTGDTSPDGDSSTGSSTGDTSTSESTGDVPGTGTTGVATTDGTTDGDSTTATSGAPMTSGDPPTTGASGDAGDTPGTSDGGTSADDPEEEGEPGCGCRSDDTGGALLATPLLLLLARRRR